MTDEQRAIIDSDEPHLFVTAAAGSGKTRVLVERFLRLVREGKRPDQILTITFTRKAAAQMKRRIVDALMEEGLNVQAQIAETGPIQTIHGFCERILRENSICAGLDPQFDILDERERGVIQSRCISEALATPFDSEEEDDTLVADLIEALAGRRGSARREYESPHAVLLRAINDILSKVRGTKVTVQDLQRMSGSPEAILDDWNRQILSVVPNDVIAIMSPSGPIRQRLEDAYKAAKVSKPRWLKPGDDDGDGAARHTAALLRIAARAWTRLEHEMKRIHRLDFILLERLAVELVEERASVRERLAKQFPVVFVDEAQDLNPLQYRLLEALMPAHRMLVGDVQQSIYGFRQADIDLFRAHPGAHNIEPTKLTKNHRSNDGILTFVDDLFRNVWAYRYTPMGPYANVEFLAGAPKPPVDGVEAWPLETEDKAAVAKMIQELVLERGSAREVCILVRKTSAGIELMQRLSHLRVPARMVGGTDQYYTRMEVRDVANALRAITNPYDDFALLATLRSPFVGISLDAFVLLGNQTEAGTSVFERIPGTELPAADREKLESFLVWFDPIRRYADRLAAWEAISELYAKSPFLENLGRRSNHARLIANARKLLSLAAAVPETGPAEFAEQVRETQRLKHGEGEAPIEDEDTDAVTIMTIHKAKGLEYDVVIVPDTFAKTRRTSWNEVFVDPRIPMIATRFPGGKSIHAEFLADRHADRDTEEEWRVLYVALTRAKKHLCVVVDPRGRPDTYAGALTRAIRLKVDDPPAGLMIRTIPC